MVTGQLARRGIDDLRVLAAMRQVPRHEFVPGASLPQAYGDHPCKLVAGQTISQPWIVARMTALLELAGGERVLEIGTGCGYQTAVLCACGAEVFSIERLGALHEQARMMLAREVEAGTVHLRHGDGREGWPGCGSFERILVTAAARELPGAWLDQLAPGGVMVAPVEVGSAQFLRRWRRPRDGGEPEVETLDAVRFVPLLPGVAEG